ncbi:TPA: restriction endonuclease subunit S [Serratia rubidaea]
MAKYRAYPEYKESGVEWLGEVPKEWDVINIKYLSQVKRGASPRPIDDPKFFDDDGDYAWVRIADVTASDTYLLETTQKMSTLGSSLSVKLEPNKLFLSIAGTVGKPCITAIKSCIHDGFVYFPCLRIPNKFLFYVFSGEQAYKGLGKMGTQLNLNTDTVGGIKVALPSNNDFIANIVNFLDHETAKIDNLIKKQQQLIELLKEKRQAVISHAVTKGLNPDVPMKDSGVEWLGDVPEHWTVSTIKYISKFIGTGGTPKNAESFTDDDGIDWFSPGDFNGSLALRNAKKKIIAQVVGNGDVKIYPKNSIVVIGIGATLGKVAFVEHEFSCNQQINIITPGKNVDHKYLTYSLLNQVEQMKQSANASTIGIMNQEKTKKIWIAFPPKDEQIKIVNVLSQKEIEFDSLLNKSEYQILLLQERRTALISAAVTGKIDVRDWVAPDAQAVEESQEATA